MVKTLQSTLIGKSVHKNDNALEICNDLSNTILDFANHASPVDTNEFTSTDDYLASSPSQIAYSPTLKDSDSSNSENSERDSQTEENSSEEDDVTSEISQENESSRQSELDGTALNRTISTDLIQQPRETMTHFLLSTIISITNISHTNCIQYVKLHCYVI